MAGMRRMRPPTTTMMRALRGLPWGLFIPLVSSFRLCPGPCFQRTAFCRYLSTDQQSSSSFSEQGKIYLDVPFQEKDHAKSLGARWDWVRKSWFITDHSKMPDFAQWQVVEVEERWEQGRKEKEGGEGVASSAVSSSAAASITPVARSMVPRPLLSGRAGLVVIFDIETTGLPKGDNFDNARIVQMCCVLCCRSTLEERERVSVIIKTDGFPVLLSKLHGITEEISLRDGELFEAAATRVGALFSQASAVIAHNVQFDTSVFQSELSRYGMLDLLTTVQDMQAICSMKTTTKLCDLKNKVGKPKPPKLNELYLHATGKQMQNHHNAIYDVLNLREALQALLVKGDVDLE